MKKHLSYSNVVSTFCLFILLGGVSWAATSLPKNSVGTAQIKKSAVNSSKVKNRSLKAVDFAKGQLPKGATGATGLQGPAGAAGVEGPTGATGSSAPGAVFGGSGGSLTSGTAYLPLSGIGSYASLVSAQMVAPADMTIGNLTVSLSNSPAAGQREFTLLVNGLPAGPGCFFFGSNTTCSDPITVSVQKFDRLAIRSEGTGNVSASVVAYSLTATAP